MIVDKLYNMPCNNKHLSLPHPDDTQDLEIPIIDPHVMDMVGSIYVFLESINII